MRSIVVEGLAKLLTFNRVHSPAVVRSVLFLYFHPDTAHLVRVRQCLSVFFPTFANAASAAGTNVFCSVVRYVAVAQRAAAV